MEVEAVEVHDFVPGGDEVVEEFVFAVGAGVNLGEGAEDGVRAKDEIDAGAGPAGGAGLAVAAFV